MNIEEMWKSILVDIYKKGTEHTKDDAKIKEILNISGFISNPLDEVKFYGEKLSKNTYIHFIKAGYFNIYGYSMKDEALAKYVMAIDDEKMIDGGDFVYTYPERLMNFITVNRFGEKVPINQIDVIVERLKENKGTNRAVATLYNSGLDMDEEHIPCFNWMQALIRDDILYLSVMFRSNDIFHAFPSNMYFISYLGMIIVDKLRETYPNLEFEGIYYQCSSCHYYIEFESEVLEVIKRGD